MNLFELSAKISMDTKDYEKAVKNAVSNSKSLKENFAKLATQSETNANKIKVLASQYDSAKSKVADLTTAFNKAAREEGVTAERTQELAKELADAEREADDLKNEMDSLSKKTKNTGDSVESLSDKLKKGLSNAAKISKIGMSAMVAFGATSVKVGADFDSAMAQVAATMGVTVGEIDNLRNFAKKMGSETAFSATQAAEALNYMALAGYDAETSMKMLPNVLNLAAAGGIELAYASDMITDAQSALGLSLEETSAMVDKMAKASSKTNTSVQQMGEAILTVGGTAKNLKGGTTELAQVLGLLADNGIKGAEGGTHLRNILLAMEPTTDAAAAAFEQLNLQAYDSSGSLRSLEDIFLDMSAAMDGMTDQEKQNIITAIFNKTDIASVNALLATTEERWGAVSAAIDDSAGAAQAMANTQLDNLEGDITLFKSALEGAQITISDALTPAIREFVQFATDAIGNLTREDVDNFLKSLQNLLPVITGLTAATVAYKTATSIAGIIDALRKATEGQTIAQALLNAVMNANPFVLIATLIAGLVAAVVTLWHTNDDFKNALIGAWDAIKNAAVVVWESIVKFFTEDIPNAFNAVINFVKNNWQSLLLFITNPIAGALKLLYDLNPKFREWVDNVWQSIKNGFNQIIDGAKTWGKDLIDNFINGIKQKWEDLKGAVSSIAQTVQDYIGFSEPKKGPLSNFHTYAPDMIDLFTKGVRDNENKLVDQIEKSFDFGEMTMGVDYGSGSYNTANQRSMSSGVSIGNITINIDGANYQDEESLAFAVAEAIENMTVRKEAVYA